MLKVPLLHSVGCELPAGQNVCLGHFTFTVGTVQDQPAGHGSSVGEPGGQ